MGSGLFPFYTEEPQAGYLDRADDGLVLLAGLFQRPKGADRHARFTVLTTRPNSLVAHVHDRMPVILPIERLDDWLASEPAAAVALIGPASEEALVARAVSKHVNSVKHDDATCIAAVPPGREGGQRSLF